VNQATLPSIEDLPPAEGLRVERQCNRFENAWKAWRGGPRPVLEEHLGGLTGPVAEVLFCELLHLELAYRRQQGELPTLEDYLRRFADRERLARGVFAREGLKEAALPQTPAPAGAEDGPSPGTAAPAPVLPHVPGYAIEGVLGKGGMGVVYKARQTSVHRVVALKMILAGDHADEQDLQRFLAEAKAVAALQHPHVVHLLDYGQQQGLPYLTLEFVPGGSLADKLRDTPLPPGEAARLVELLAEGMHYAHGKGIVHRDLKPHNVLLAEDGTPKITDFGLAKRLEVGSGLTASGAVMGTPSYMAPEQVSGDGKRVGPLADVYALGAILYECLTGRPPFRAATPVDTLMQVIAEEPAAVRSLQPGVPRDLETICHKCLHKEPRRRYATARELAEDLRRFQKGEPVRARPVGLGERAAKWVRRRPLVAALLGLVVLLTAGGLGGVFWAYGEALHERNHAQDEATNARLAEEKTRDQLQETQKAEKKVQEQLKKTERALANSRIMLADDAWQKGSVRQARDHLDEVSGELRRWEWHYLKRTTAGGLFTLHGHTASVNSVCFSPDGKRIASASGWRPEPGEMKVWDARIGQQLLSLKVYPGDGGVCFSPDWRRAACSSDDTAHVFDARTGQKIFDLGGHTDPVSSVCFSPDGSRLATTSSRGGTAKVWDAWTGHQLLTLREPRGKGAASVAFSPDGQRLATGGVSGATKVWDARAGQQLLDLQGDDGWVGSVCFSPDGKRLASASSGLWDEQNRQWRPGAVKVWDAQTGKEIHTLRGHTGPVMSVAFSPDGRRMASAGGRTGEAGELKLWDAQTGREVLALQGHTKAVTSVCFSPDSQRLATASRDGTVKVWDVRPDQELLPPSAHGGAVLSVCFTPDGTRLATAGGGWDGHTQYWGEVKVWDAQTGQEALSLKGHTAPFTSVCFSPDGKRLAGASGGYDGSSKPLPGEVKVWDVKTEQEVLALKGYTGFVFSLCFSPDRERLAIASGVLEAQ
jgi:WD40 repeat protein/tRNA A-37 threonylcarbamoyl transferase component Bud32